MRNRGFFFNICKWLKMVWFNELLILDVYYMLVVIFIYIWVLVIVFSGVLFFYIDG